MKRFKALVAQQNTGLLSGADGNNAAFQELKYHCPECRQNTRAIQIQQLIERLANEDKQYYFQEPVEDQIEGYTKIIKTPMCFQYIRQRARTPMYLTDALALRRDVALIFENATKFNLPKHKVHKEAKKLGLICAAIIDTVQTKLDLNASRTIDEQRHSEYLRRERRHKLM